ncbi:MAG: 23S rRNA (adenine(2503)-C(2))-methyltransferase RlmN [Spirochaetota bacterium]|nr:23S rRNA (adenine(2503)-C(2))-methyltransferase RlmN [Spirochaetota bacterium]
MYKSSVKNLSHGEAVQVFADLGEKRYRAKQLFNWLYEKNVDSFFKMTNFSKDLRNQLECNYSISPIVVEDRLISDADCTQKFLFRTYDGNFIEALLIQNDREADGRVTICLSSQIGCAMGCRFCQTARIGFKRNLNVAEILDQVCQIRRITGLKNNNIVFMGMGEPLLNYINVLKAADIMNYSFGFHISVRKITISTCGIRDGIERFIDEGRLYNLAISLNDTMPDKRRVNMPVEKRYPISDIVNLLNNKFPASRNRLTIEYVMRRDNISYEDAKRLKRMFKYNRIKLNLIKLNSGEHDYEIPSDDEVMRFAEALEIMNIPITMRRSFGNDINGACGQLSGQREAYHSVR